MALAPAGAAARPQDLAKSSADIQAPDRQGQGQAARRPLISQPVVGTGGYRASLEYRSGAPAPASIHDTEAELMVVVDGSGTITTGGTLVEGKRTNPTNQSRHRPLPAARPQHVVKGDMLIVVPADGHAALMSAAEVARCDCSCSMHLLPAVQLCTPPGQERMS